MSKVLCISGMHRSGTSLVTSWLERCGLTICDGRRLGLGAGNIKGLFEDRDFFDLHSGAIRREHPASSGWKIVERRKMVFSSQDRSTARQLVEERTSKYPIWGWKDPRTVLFLDQWKKIIPDLKVLLLYRPCHHVVDSLIRRSNSVPSENVEKISMLEAVRMWGIYSHLICTYKERYSEDTLLLPLYGVLEKDRTTIERIRCCLNIDLEYFSIEHLYEPDLLRRHSPGADQFLCHIVAAMLNFKINKKIRRLSWI